MLGRVAILAIGLAALAALAAACTNADEPGPAPLTGSADPGGTTEVPVEALPAKLPEPYIILGDGSADEEARTEIIARLVDEKLLYQEALRRGILT